MGLMFTLRMMGDLALYLCAAATVGRIFGLTHPPVLPLLIMTAASGAAFALRAAKRPAARLAPFGTLALCGFFVYGPADFLVLLPAAGYCVATAWYRRFDSDGGALRARFLRAVKIIPPLALIGLFFSRQAIEQLMLPFALIYLAVTVYLLQMLRQSAAVLGQRRFRMLNLAVLGAVCVLGLLLSTPAFLAGLWAAAGAVYRHAIAPVLLAMAMGIAYILTGLGWLLAPIFRWLTGRNTPPAETEGDTGGALEQFVQEVAAGRSAEIIGRALAALAVIGLMALAVWVLRRMLAPAGRAGPEAGPLDSRSAMASGRGGRDKQSRPRGPRGQVRAVFRRFLRHCRARGVHLGPSATSLSATAQAARESWCPESAAAALREIYIRARYSGHAITREQARQAGAAWAAIRAQARKNKP